MRDGATSPQPPQTPPTPPEGGARARIRRYRVRNSRATVFDALNAFHDLDFRADIADAILGRIPCGQEFDGRAVSIALSPDLTAHGIEITWPLDVAAHAGVVAYVLPSSVDEVAL